MEKRVDVKKSQFFHSSNILEEILQTKLLIIIFHCSKFHIYDF